MLTAFERGDARSSGPHAACGWPTGLLSVGAAPPEAGRAKTSARASTIVMSSVCATRAWTTSMRRPRGGVCDRLEVAGEQARVGAPRERRRRPRERGTKRRRDRLAPCEPALRRQCSAREAVEGDLRDHPRLGSPGPSLDGSQRVDPRGNDIEREHVDLAQRARILLGEARHRGTWIGLDEARIASRALMRGAEREHPLVLAAKRAEILSIGSIHVHGPRRDPSAPPPAILVGPMSDKRREVEELRQEIGKVDAQLLSSLERRGKLSKRIGELRKSMTVPPALPDRGQIEVLVGKSAGDIPQAALREIFREISRRASRSSSRSSSRTRASTEASLTQRRGAASAWQPSTSARTPWPRRSTR